MDDRSDNRGRDDGNSVVDRGWRMYKGPRAIDDLQRLTEFYFEFYSRDLVVTRGALCSMLPNGGLLREKQNAGFNL